MQMALAQAVKQRLAVAQTIHHQSYAERLSLYFDDGYTLMCTYGSDV